MRNTYRIFGGVTLMLLATHCTRASEPQPLESAGSQELVPVDNPHAELLSTPKHVTARFDASVARVLADVTLPRSAKDAFEVRAMGGRSGQPFGIRVSLEGARDVEAQVDRGLVRYTGALGAGTEVLHRISPDGTEDFAKFARAPQRAALVYRVELDDTVAALRQIGDAVEFVDRDGAPRLAMHAPWGVDAKGQRFAAHTEVLGCAVDRDPRAPWGRSLPAPGAGTCTVKVTWAEDIAYPAAVDPAWAAGASMAATNISHEMLMAKLTGGRVLVVNAGLSTQLFDPATNTWANTGAPLRAGHRSRMIATDGNTAALATNDGYLGRYSLATGMWTASNTVGAVDSDGIAMANLGGNELLFVEASGRTRTYNYATDVFTAKTNASVSVGCNPALLPLGGNKFALNGCASATLRIYDLAANTWSANAARLAGDVNCNHLVLLAGNKVLSYGRDGGAAVLDLTAGTSKTITATPNFFQFLCARTENAPLGGGLHYVWGGRYTYNEATETFVDNGVFPSTAAFHGAIVKLDDGRFLAAGGNESGTFYRFVDIYGPSAQADCDGVVATPVYNATLRKCVACDGDNGGATPAKCPTAGKPVCNTAGALIGQCTECGTGKEAACVGTKPRCNTTTGACVACDGGFGAMMGSALCNVATAPVCQATGACVAANGDKGTAASAPCPTDANPFVKADGSCGKCTTNAECAGATHAGPICNATSGACGTTCARDADCSAAQFCDVAGTKMCVAKRAEGGACTAASQCTSGSCTSGKCDKACTGNADCGAGAFCDTAANPKICKATKADGEACSNAAECKGGACTAGKCGAPSSSSSSSSSSSGGAVDGGASSSSGNNGDAGGGCSSSSGSTSGLAAGLFGVAFALSAARRRRRA